ncbi:MAG: hypothetical protein O9302_15285 [Cyclobacteriaceae bacterium]|jgi:hypothetical protein|nr:hypothetical protein [Cytophagales bacterium]MCZ8329426.1 hypothetical protein [Cyclobacteriaceae bacterium]
MKYQQLVADTNMLWGMLDMNYINNLKVLITILFLSIIVFCCNTKSTNFWSDSDLISPATSVKLYSFKLTINNSDTIVHKNHISNYLLEMKYNFRGQIEESNTYDYDSIENNYKHSANTISKFNSKGFLDSEHEEYYLPKVTATSKVINHDKKGKPILIKRFFGDDNDTLTIIINDFTEVTISSIFNSIISVDSFKFENSFLSYHKSIWYGQSKEDTIIYETSYKYRKFDKKGNWIERILNNSKYGYSLERREIIYE